VRLGDHVWSGRVKSFWFDGDECKSKGFRAGMAGDCTQADFLLWVGFAASCWFLQCRRRRLGVMRLHAESKMPGIAQVTDESHWRLSTGKADAL